MSAWAHAFVHLEGLGALLRSQQPENFGVCPDVLDHLVSHCLRSLTGQRAYLRFIKLPISGGGFDLFVDLAHLRSRSFGRCAFCIHNCFDREIADDANFEARSRNRSVRVNAPDACVISGTEDLLRRAIENVIRNGVQYTAEGTEVRIDLTCTNAASKTADATALITVRDRGPGVPDHALNEIFRPFYRVEDARDRESGGAGLGLAIADRSVRLHGGTVSAANAVDGGLVVTISLPTLKIRSV
jgi:two-component system sensor histidine kinase CpxA